MTKTFNCIVCGGMRYAVKCGCCGKVVCHECGTVLTDEQANKVTIGGVGTA